MKNVFFNPFVGKHYQNDGFSGKKILVLGESHYCGGCNRCGDLTTDDVLCREFTSRVITAFLAYKSGDAELENWMRTFTRFTNVMLGEQVDSKTIVEFWNSILFYNYVQSANADKPRISPTEEEFSNSETAFFEVLTEFQPDIIIVWGDRLWKSMPTNGKWGEEILDGKFGKLYYYNSNGKEIPAFGVYHPSSSYFSYELMGYLQEAVRKA